ncbi:MAG: hypothetical protein N4A52_10555 [Halodesulfovibrio sp.]|nr:hypothetical protein [Halodesulfovibrio sp.]
MIFTMVVFTFTVWFMVGLHSMEHFMGRIMRWMLMIEERGASLVPYFVSVTLKNTQLVLGNAGFTG